MVILRKVAHTAGLPGGAGGDEPPASAGDVGDVGLIPGSGRPPGVGNATFSHIPAWETAGGPQSMGLQSDTTEQQ